MARLVKATYVLRTAYPCLGVRRPRVPAMIDRNLVCQAAGGTGVDESFRLGGNNNHGMEEVRGSDWIQREAGWQSYYYIWSRFKSGMEAEHLGNLLHTE